MHQQRIWPGTANEGLVQWWPRSFERNGDFEDGSICFFHWRWQWPTGKDYWNWSLLGKGDEWWKLCDENGFYALLAQWLDRKSSSTSKVCFKVMVTGDHTASPRILQCSGILEKPIRNASTWDEKCFQVELNQHVFLCYRSNLISHLCLNILNYNGLFWLC